MAPDAVQSRRSPAGGDSVTLDGGDRPCPRDRHERVVVSATVLPDAGTVHASRARWPARKSATPAGLLRDLSHQIDSLAHDRDLLDRLARGPRCPLRPGGRGRRRWDGDRLSARTTFATTGRSPLKVVRPELAGALGIDRFLREIEARRPPAASEHPPGLRQRCGGRGDAVGGSVVRDAVRRGRVAAAAPSARGPAADRRRRHSRRRDRGRAGLRPR